LIVRHVGRDVATAKLHPFDILHFRDQAASFFYGDDAVSAHVVEYFGYGLTDVGIVSSYGGHLGNLCARLDGFTHGLDLFYQSLKAPLQADTQQHWIRSCRDVLETFS